MVLIGLPPVMTGVAERLAGVPMRRRAGPTWPAAAGGGQVVRPATPICGRARLCGVGSKSVRLLAANPPGNGLAPTLSEPTRWVSTRPADDFWQGRRNRAPGAGAGTQKKGAADDRGPWDGW